jgi:hypothetical protein
MKNPCEGGFDGLSFAGIFVFRARVCVAGCSFR